MKTFQIQIQDGPGTRWQATDEEIIRQIQLCTEATAAAASTGEIPRVIVSVEKIVCEICAERAATSLTTLPKLMPVYWCVQCMKVRVPSKGVRCVECSKLPPTNEAPATSAQAH